MPETTASGERGPGRVLGLDLGESRIGVAISDEGRRVAVPLGTVRTGAPQDVKAIAAMVEENDASEVVVGLPTVVMGVELNPGDEVGTMMIEIPRCFFTSGFVRHANHT